MCRRKIPHADSLRAACTPSFILYRSSHAQMDQVGRAFIFYRTKVQGLREVAHWQNENRASGLIQRWARGTMVRKRIPLASRSCYAPLKRELVTLSPCCFKRFVVSNSKTQRHSLCVRMFLLHLRVALQHQPNLWSPEIVGIGLSETDTLCSILKKCYALLMGGCKIVGRAISLMT